MRILLDACIPKRLKREFAGHDVWTAREAGLNMVSDGQLLVAMTDKYDILITMDKCMQFQQRLEGGLFAVVLLRAKSNRLPDLLLLLPKLVDAISKARAGEVTEVSVKSCTLLGIAPSRAAISVSITVVRDCALRSPQSRAAATSTLNTWPAKSVSIRCTVAAS
jgi:predicted nuclease of predicted toxin-antitoxin system